MPDDVKVDATDTTAADTTSAADTTAKVDTKADAGKVADAKADAAKTIATDDKADAADADKGKAPPAWPDDWRDRLSGKDEKLLKRLTRFQSPENVFKSYVALENRLNAGELKEPLAEKATPEQTAAWREKNGIPASPDKYELKLSDGLVVGEEHKPLVDAFLKVAHDGNMRPEDVNRTVDWYFRSLDEAAQQKYEADVTFRLESEDALHQEWGQDYRGYVNAIASLLQERAPEGFAERFFSARTPDGRLLGNDPDTLKMLAQLAIDLNPAATVVPGSGQTSASQIEDRLGQIQKMLGDFQSDYYKEAGGVGAKIQAEYLQLLEAKARLKERHAA